MEEQEPVKKKIKKLKVLKTERVEAQKEKIRTDRTEHKGMKQKREDRRMAKLMARQDRDKDRPLQKVIKKKDRDIRDMSIKLATALDMTLKMEKERDEVLETIMAINLMTSRNPNLPVGVLKKDTKAGVIILRRDLVFALEKPVKTESISVIMDGYDEDNCPTCGTIGKSFDDGSFDCPKCDGGDIDGQEEQARPKGQEEG